MNTVRKINELLDSVNQRENEALFVTYAKDGELARSVAAGNVDDIQRMFERIVMDALEPDASKSQKLIASAIVGAVINVTEEILFEDDEDEDDDISCDECELNRVCDDEKAIAYRKAHGIPRPKKGKGRKVNVN
jgi:nitrogen fixation-related uncharacterized protein